jgi:hypothetical protein
MLELQRFLLGTLDTVRDFTNTLPILQSLQRPQNRSQVLLDQLNSKRDVLVIFVLVLVRDIEGHNLGLFFINKDGIRAMRVVNDGVFQRDTQASRQVNGYLSQLAQGNTDVPFDELVLETFLRAFVFLPFDILERLVHPHALGDEKALEAVKQTLLQSLVVDLLRQDNIRPNNNQLEVPPLTYSYRIRLYPSQ